MGPIEGQDRHIWLEALLLGLVSGAAGGGILLLVSDALIAAVLTPLVVLLLTTIDNPYLVLPVYPVLVIIVYSLSGMLSGFVAATPGYVLARLLFAWSPSARARWHLLWLVAGIVTASMLPWIGMDGSVAWHQFSDPGEGAQHVRAEPRSTRKRVDTSRTIRTTPCRSVCEDPHHDRGATVRSVHLLRGCRSRVGGRLPG